MSTKSPKNKLFFTFSKKIAKFFYNFVLRIVYIIGGFSSPQKIKSTEAFYGTKDKISHAVYNISYLVMRAQPHEDIQAEIILRALFKSSMDDAAKVRL